MVYLHDATVQPTFMTMKELINRLFDLVIERSRFSRDKRYNFTCIDNYKIHVCIILSKIIHVIYNCFLLEFSNEMYPRMLRSLDM